MKHFLICRLSLPIQRATYGLMTVLLIAGSGAGFSACGSSKSKSNTATLRNGNQYGRATNRPYNNPHAPDARASNMGVSSNPTNSNPPNDANIAHAVRNEIRSHRAADVRDLAIKSSDGIVTLNGTSPTLLGKNRAEAIANTVRGVRSVINLIDVQPEASPSDAELARDVKDALLYDRATDSYQIDPSAHDGKVTLNGTVDSFQERDLANTVASGVQGVRSVENNITVRYRFPRPDSEIQQDVASKLRWDSLVDRSLIGVTVHNGEVTLRGTVGSAAEKTRAMRDAWLTGVRGVDISQLHVRPWANDPNQKEHRYEVKPDAQVREAVREALKLDPRVSKFDVNVDVLAGVVTLSGVVDNLQAARAAARTTRNTLGVLGVNNRLAVRPSTPTDVQIAENIRNALRRDPYVDQNSIDVQVNDGVATLTGTVKGYFEKADADNVAASAYGVKSVKNKLKVDYADQPYIYDPYIAGYDPYIYDWYNYRYVPRASANRSDREIKSRIQTELWWSPFVDENEVNVSVRNGVATLTGQVASWAELDSAIENAYEGGAGWVDSKLTVGSSHPNDQGARNPNG